MRDSSKQKRIIPSNVVFERIVIFTIVF